jgi:hypothetical protein
MDRLIRLAARFVGRLFWIEVVLACITGFLAMLTAVHPDWIEAVFGVDPDRRSVPSNGSLSVAVLSRRLR